MVVSIYVGTDRWQRDSNAEAVLQYSIWKYATEPVEIHWMRSGDPGFEVGVVGTEEVWGCGHDGSAAWPKRGWGTPFSCFRMAVPELANFEGVHIYLDADMVLLADISELLRLPRRRPWLSNNRQWTDVSVIDASAFKNLSWWPSIKQMRASNQMMHAYRALLAQHDFFDESLPWEWNMRDQLLPNGKLLHYTSVPTQPYQPYPSVQYYEHPSPEVAAVWHNMEKEMHGII